MLVNANRSDHFVLPTTRAIDIVEWETMDLVRLRYTIWKVKTWASLERGLEIEMSKSRYAMTEDIFDDQV